MLLLQDFTVLHTGHIRRSIRRCSIRIWRALHEYVNFVQGPENQYRSLSTAYRPHLWPVCKSMNESQRAYLNASTKWGRENCGITISSNTSSRNRRVKNSAIIWHATDSQSGKQSDNITKNFHSSFPNPSPLLVVTRTSTCFCLLVPIESRAHTQVARMAAAQALRPL